MDGQSYYLVLYDVSDDKRRRLLFKMLKSFGASYQYSVFEARLDDRQLVRLEAKIKEFISKSEDRVAVLKLCNSCRKDASLMGTQATTICQHVLIV